MLDGLRKVVHIEVFDFDSDVWAYAVNSNENQFGYKYQEKYLKGNEVVKTKMPVNNVERGFNYYHKFGINLNQLRSLRRRVKRLGDRMYPFEDENGVDVLVKGGSHIIYRGDNPDDFFQKVLKIKR